MRRTLSILFACLALTQLSAFAILARAESPSAAPLDVDIPNGHFYTQTNGSALGSSPGGYAVTNDSGVPFWDAFRQFGGVEVLGYPVTSRFMYDGFVTQAMQKVVFQWRPDTGQVNFLNTFDALHDRGRDDWLLNYRQTPRPLDTNPDAGLPWEQVVARHLALLDPNQPIKDRFLADPAWLDHFGLPVAYADMGNSFVIRAQRATFQFWKEDVPWAKKGEVSVANGGDLAKEAGLWPQEAVALSLPDGQPAPGNQALALAPAAQPAAAPTAVPQPTAVPMGPRIPGIYYAKSPEYGIHMLLAGYPTYTGRDLGLASAGGFRWVKTLMQWREIERNEKGKYYWEDAERVVKEVNNYGFKVIVRVDFQPGWARNDSAYNGPPWDPQNYGDFINALVGHFRTGGPNGHIDAVEIWNEPNLSHDWGEQKPNAAQYVRLLKAAYEGAKRADPSVIVITAGLSPTGTNNDFAVPDDVYLQQMYEAGAKPYFDVLGAHAPGYKAPPEMSGDQVAADPSYGGHRVFTFRRVEDLRNIMVRNGDSGKQVWLTEFGWTSDPVHPAYAWHAVTEEQKAQYLVRAFQWARNNWSPWIGVMNVWNFPRPDWGPQHEEYWWSIIEPDGRSRPAYAAFKAARENGTLP